MLCTFLCYIVLSQTWPKQDENIEAKIVQNQDGSFQVVFRLKDNQQPTETSFQASITSYDLAFTQVNEEEESNRESTEGAKDLYELKHASSFARETNIDRIMCQFLDLSSISGGNHDSGRLTGELVDCDYVSSLVHFVDVYQ